MMSTNYYFAPDLEKYKDVFGDSPVYNLLTKFVGNEKIHIGKRSGGWLPLFQKTEHYSSVKEIEEFWENNEEVLIIEDEYGYRISIEELRSELFEWGSKHNKLNHQEYLGIYVDNEGYEFSENTFS